MTPDQLDIARAFEQVRFRSGSEERKFADALIATARKNPSHELTDQQDKYVRDLAFKYRREMPVGLVIQQVQHGYSTLQWLAPNLTSHSKTCATHTGKKCDCTDAIIKDEPWVASNAQKAVALFPNKSLHTCAALLAALHPYAYDYIAQAPVLILAITQGSTLSKANERKRISREWVSRFETGGKLRDMMASINLAYPLRKLHPAVLETNHWETVQALCTIEPSTLSQIIPEREDQKEWLQSIGTWTAQTRRRFTINPAHFEWMCRLFNPDAMRRAHTDVREAINQIGPIADFAGTFPARFNVRWTLDRAIQETRRWHDELARATHEEKFFLENGKGWEEPIDYTPFPAHAKIDEYDFVALQSGKQLFEEGREMHHCVGTYSRHVISGSSRIYAVINLETEKRVATVEYSTDRLYHAPAERLPDMHETAHQVADKQYRQRWHMVQVKGPYNQAVSKECQKAVKRFEERLNYLHAMWEHEHGNRELYAHRLEKVMLEPMPMMLLQREDFPGLDAMLLRDIDHERTRQARADRGAPYEPT